MAQTNYLMLTQNVLVIYGLLTKLCNHSISSTTFNTNYDQGELLDDDGKLLVVEPYHDYATLIKFILSTAAAVISEQLILHNKSNKSDLPTNRPDPQTANVTANKNKAITLSLQLVATLDLVQEGMSHIIPNMLDSSLYDYSELVVSTLFLLALCKEAVLPQLITNSADPSDPNRKNVKCD